MRVPWSLPARRGKRVESSASLRATVGSAVESVVGLAPSTLKVARAALIEQQLTLPFRAPKTMFNVKIGGARRVAAQSWPLKRIKNVKEAAGTTVNDVVLAMCAGALRAYLEEEHALPDTPLVAMVPVNLRSESDVDAGGNMVGTILCNLATHLDDPAARLDVISGSMRDNKKVFAQLPKPEQLALSAVLTGGIALDLQRPRCTRADVLERRPARWQLPAFHRTGRAGREHHVGQQRRQPRLRSRRLQAQRSAYAAAPRPSGVVVGGSRTGSWHLDRRLEGPQ
jgi:WS/DGAT/MGAT family acyltransferase